MIHAVCSDADAQTWAKLRHRLWPHASYRELLVEARAFAATGEMPIVAAAFLAENERNATVGFIELAIRAFADGCESKPVPHIEGWYVEPDARRCGYGRALMGRAEAWARERGFSELASDTEIDNAISLEAHATCGFTETERLVKLRKALRQ